MSISITKCILRDSGTETDVLVQLSQLFVNFFKASLNFLSDLFIWYRGCHLVQYVLVGLWC